jgi:hypothetical protein
MDATPDLKTRPKPFEVSAAIGKLYYGRARWSDARDFFTQAEKTAEPVRNLFLQQRKQVKGAPRCVQRGLPDRRRHDRGQGGGAGPYPRGAEGNPGPRRRARSRRSARSRLHHAPGNSLALLGT